MNKKKEIRTINVEDYPDVYNVLRESFWNLYRPGCEEHLLAKQIFASEDYLPKLSFVIELNGEIIGCIIYTILKVKKDNGNYEDLISFGPVCILPKFHRQGYGRDLIEYSINQAKLMGYKAIVIAGFRKHYKCYGFESAKKYGLRMQDGKFYHGIMALELYQNALDNISGELCFAECMADPTKEELECFDKMFDAKLKEVLPCQKEFLIESLRIEY